MMLPWERIETVLNDTDPLKLSGRVVRSKGLIVEGTLPGARVGMMCRLMIRGRPEGVPAEVVALRDGRVSFMPLGEVPGISEGSRIEPISMDPTIGVGDDMIGRVLDGLGQPIDGGPPIHATARQLLRPPPHNPLHRNKIGDALHMGITALDSMLTCAQGQRVVIMAGAGVGKSTLLGMMARHTAADVTVVALIGERSREVKEFVEDGLGQEGLSRSVVVASTGDTSPALRIRAACVATAIAEYFSGKGLRVLLLMDSLTRVAMAQRDLGLATGEMPGTRGYPPSAFAIIPKLVERAGPGVSGGSITAFYTALLEGDDTKDPVGDYIRASTDGHVVLNRRLAEQQHFPAIDVLASVSRVMTNVVSPEHQRASGVLRRLISELREAEEMRSMGAYRPGENPQYDRLMPLATPLRTFMTQSPGEHRGQETVLSQMVELADWYERVEREGASTDLAAASGEAEA